VTTGARAAGHAWRQDMSAAAKPRARLSRGGLRWALTALVRQHLTVAKIAGGLGVSWNTADDAVLAEGRRVLISDPHRFDGAKVVGVDEHIWRHTRCGDKYVTVIIDLTPVRDRTGPARLLDMVEGRSKQVFKTWLAERDETWRAAVEVVALHGFTGFKTAAVEELGSGVTVVVDPFHVVRLGGECLELCRRRVQQQTRGHRGRAGDLLYSARRSFPPARTCSPTSNGNGSRRCSPMAPTCRSMRPGVSTRRWPQSPRLVGLHHRTGPSPG
jgi:hypothetical protein